MDTIYHKKDNQCNVISLITVVASRIPIVVSFDVTLCANVLDNVNLFSKQFKSVGSTSSINDSDRISLSSLRPPMYCFNISQFKIFTWNYFLGMIFFLLAQMVFQVTYYLTYETYYPGQYGFSFENH